MGHLQIIAREKNPVSSQKPSRRKISAMKSLFELSSLDRPLDTPVEVAVPTNSYLLLRPDTDPPVCVDQPELGRMNGHEHKDAWDRSLDQDCMDRTW